MARKLRQGILPFKIEKSDEPIMARGWTGFALRDVILDCLAEIEVEVGTNTNPRLKKLQAFVKLTRKGKGVTEASRIISVRPEYVSRSLKATTIQLLSERLRQKLH
jgi:hypothetical protein